MLETLLLKNGNEIVKKSEIKPAMTSTFSMENLLNSKIVGKLSGQKNLMIKIKKEKLNQLSPNGNPDSETDDEMKWRGNEESQNEYYSENSRSPNYESQNQKSEDSENKEYIDGNYEGSRSPDQESQGSGQNVTNFENSPKTEDERYDVKDVQNNYILQRIPSQTESYQSNMPPHFFKQDGVLNQFFRNENHLILSNNLVNRNSIFSGHHNPNLCTLDCCKNIKTMPFYQNRNYIPNHQCSGMNCLVCGNARLHRHGCSGVNCSSCKTVESDKNEQENVVVNLKMNKNKDGEDRDRSPVRTNDSPIRSSEAVHSSVENSKPVLKFSVSAILGTDQRGIRQNQGEQFR